MNVDYLDGMLSSISELCGRVNFNPIFGAEELKVTNNNINESILSHFKGKCAEPKEITKHKLAVVISDELRGYMEDSMFGGVIKEYNIDIKSYTNKLALSLSHGIQDIVSKNYKYYEAKLVSSDYGIQAEAIIIHGNDRCLCLYFGWTD